MITMNTPNMNGKAADIDNPILLMERIGYRTYLMWRDPDSPRSLYEGFNKTDLRRIRELELET